MNALAVVQKADAVPWLVLAGIVLAAWTVLFVVVTAATMPRLPDPGPETMDVGPEPPAVANFLVNRCEVTTSALSATLVDLAARGHVALEDIGGGQQLVRLRRQSPDTTNAYEAEILALVRKHASNDTVPAAELSLGYGDTADRWWNNFQRAVVDHARELGLVRRRFSHAQSVVLAATLAVPFVLAGIGFEVYGTATRAAHKTGKGGIDTGGGMVLAAALWITLLVIGARVLRGWRDTPAGVAATARWLGVRNFLRRDEAFRETPPAGVVLWKRLLSYGVALGAAHGTDAALPIGPTRNNEGWSPYRGLWRQVRITYPKRFGYGDPPPRAAAVSLLVLAGSAVAGVVVARTFVPGLLDTIDRMTRGNGASDLPILAALSAILVLPVAYVSKQVVRSVVMLQRAIADFGRHETFDGYVVRVPWHYVSDNDGGGRWQPAGYTAVDDGRGDEVHALRYYNPNVREGQTVRVTLTPRMRHVIGIEGAPHVTQHRES
jgi:hypothetical protein